MKTKERLIKKKKKNKGNKENKEETTKNPKTKTQTSKKIILETSADLYNLPISAIKNTKLYDFSGKYFEQIYKDLLKAEKNGGELEISNIYNKTSVNKKEIRINKIIIRIINPFFKANQELGIIGSIKELGNWNQDKSQKMDYYEEENIWQKELILNKKEDFEYKFIFISNGVVKKWEDGNNRIFKYSLLKN